MTHAAPRSPALAPLIVSAALLMETTDATVLATALPTIAGALNAPVLSLKLALASYLVALAVFIPMSGWLADRIGAKPVFMAAIGVFLLGSLLCAMQTNLSGLVLARAIQGFGGAMMTPVGRLIVLHSTPKQELVRAMTFITLPALLGPALGPLVGSIVAASVGWRWIFLINLPIGVLGLALAWRFLPSPPVEPHPRFDWPGFALAGASLGAALFGMSALGDHLIATQAAAALILAGGAGLVLYWRHALRAPAPLLDPRLFDWRTFRVGVIGGLLFRTSGGALSFLLPLLFQLGFGFSIIMSGALSAVFALGSLIMRGLAPGLIDRFGFRPVLAAGTLASGACVAGFAAFQDYSPWLLALLLLAGAAQAAVFTAANGVAYAEIDEADMSRATSLAAVSQQAAITLGIAVGASVLQAGGDPAPHAPPLAAHFAPAFLAVAIVSTSALALFLALRRGDGDSLRHKHSDHRKAHGL
ncbi:MAG: MFS transporter [Hyphomonadaceae bacterium]|nr:MFS transporter [Hyphomonadaceae bacterium]